MSKKDVLRLLRICGLAIILMIIVAFIDRDHLYVFEALVSVIMLAALASLAFILIITGINTGRSSRLFSTYDRRAVQLDAEGALFVSKSRHKVMIAVQMPGQKIKYRRYQVAVMPKYVALYPAARWRDVITFNRSNIRWVDRIAHLDSELTDIDLSESKLSIEVDYRWHTLYVRMPSEFKDQFEQALLTIVPDELQTKRNRQRPEKHHGPVDVYPVGDTLSERWDTSDPVQLYLTPLWLVLLGNGIVIREIALDDIDAVRSTDETSCLYLTIGDETLMFETSQYRDLELLLAEVTK